MKQCYPLNRRRTRLTLERLEARAATSALPLTAIEQVFLERMNDYRASLAKPLAPFAFDATLKPYVMQTDRYANRVSALKTAIKRDRANVDLSKSVTFGVGSTTDRTLLNGTDAERTAAVEDLVSLYIAFSFGPNPLAGKHMNKLYTYHRIMAGGIYESTSPQNSPTIVLADLTAAPATTKPIVTGTVFHDSNGNRKYDVGEGLSGVNITASGKLGGTTVWDTGGYSLPVSVKKSTTIIVTASGGGLSGPVSQVLVVRPGQNVRANFIVA